MLSVSPRLTVATRFSSLPTDPALPAITDVRASPTPFLASPLLRGMSGAPVKQLQLALVKLKLMSPAAYASGPGVFGPRTQAAVRELQRLHGLTTNGTFNQETRRVLIHALVARRKAQVPQP